MNAPGSSLLVVENLTKHFPLRAGLSFGRGRVHAVDGVSFSLERRRTLALVGESGSGKTTIGRCVLRLTEPTAGRIWFRGEEISAMPARRFRAMRRHVQMVFQDFEGALNPRHTIRRALREPFVRFGLCEPRHLDEAVRAAVREVEMRPEDLDKYPHQLSGGQQQRIAIARAMAPRPDLIVLDEPLSSLDVSVRAQVAGLLGALQQQHGVAYLLISHDLDVVRAMAHEVAVLYLGQIAEHGAAQALFEHPRHPYTRALLDSILVPDPERADLRPVLEGEIPSATNPPIGCRFQGRCPRAADECRVGPIELRIVGDGHRAACCRIAA